MDKHDQVTEMKTSFQRKSVRPSWSNYTHFKCRVMNEGVAWDNGEFAGLMPELAVRCDCNAGRYYERGTLEESRQLKDFWGMRRTAYQLKEAPLRSWNPHSHPGNRLTAAGEPAFQAAQKRHQSPMVSEQNLQVVAEVIPQNSNSKRGTIHSCDEQQSHSTGWKTTPLDIGPFAWNEIRIAVSHKALQRPQNATIFICAGRCDLELRSPVA